ncbi:MAG: antitoxin Xre/MbcA/ParS toxin-binding domain-containing protein [Actinomycetota bacterium]
MSALAQRIDKITGVIKARDIAQLLDTTPQTVSRWRTSRAAPQRASLERLLSLEWLIDQLREFYEPDAARLWLFSPHPLLRGLRPVDKIRDGAIDEVLALIAQLQDGAYV